MTSIFLSLLRALGLHKCCWGQNWMRSKQSIQIRNNQGNLGCSSFLWPARPLIFYAPINICHSLKYWHTSPGFITPSLIFRLASWRKPARWIGKWLPTILQIASKASAVTKLSSEQKEEMQFALVYMSLQLDATPLFCWYSWTPLSKTRICNFLLYALPRSSSNGRQ